jgi:stringent starvation protein B
MISAIESSSTRPYLVRALYEWCTDNGFTPYIAVQVDDTVQVPREYVKNGEIVLNISFDATSSLKLGNEFIEFKARFAGTAREIIVPVGRVIAIYARENGQGMAFPAPAPGSAQGAPAAPVSAPAGSSLALSPPGKGSAARGAEADAARIVHLVTGDAEAGSNGSGATVSTVTPSEGDDEPPKPPGGAGARPSLKRIK